MRTLSSGPVETLDEKYHAEVTSALIGITGVRLFANHRVLI